MIPAPWTRPYPNCNQATAPQGVVHGTYFRTLGHTRPPSLAGTHGWRHANEISCLCSEATHDRRRVCCSHPLYKDRPQPAGSMRMPCPWHSLGSWRTRPVPYGPLLRLFTGNTLLLRTLSLAGQPAYAPRAVRPLAEAAHGRQVAAVREGQPHLARLLLRPPNLLRLRWRPHRPGVNISACHASVHRVFCCSHWHERQNKESHEVLPPRGSDKACC